MKMRARPALHTPRRPGPARVLGEGFSDGLQERKRLYRSRAWQRIREVHLSNHPYCEECLRRGIRNLGRVVDHVEGHEGDWRLRFFVGPFQTLCTAHHNAKAGYEAASHRRAGR